MSFIPRIGLGRLVSGGAKLGVAGLIVLALCTVVDPVALASKHLGPYKDKAQAFATKYAPHAFGVAGLLTLAGLGQYVMRGKRTVSTVLANRAASAGDRELLEHVDSDEATRAFKQSVLDNPATARNDASDSANRTFTMESGTYSASHRRTVDQKVLLTTRLSYLAALEADLRSYADDFKRLSNGQRGDTLRRLAELSEYSNRRAIKISQAHQACTDSLADLNRGKDQSVTILTMLQNAGIRIA